MHAMRSWRRCLLDQLLLSVAHLDHSHPVQVGLCRPMNSGASSCVTVGEASWEAWISCKCNEWPVPPAESSSSARSAVVTNGYA